MGFRRSSNRHNRWAAFIATNDELVAATGLPSKVLRSETVLVDFLTSGVDDELSLSLATIPDHQFLALEAVVNAYFYDGLEQTIMLAFSKQRLERFERYG